MSTWHSYSGGGGKGSFAICLLRELVNLGALPADRGPDGVVGCSVGAFVAAGIAQSPKEEFGAGVEYTYQMWKRNIRRDKDVYRWYFPPFLSGLTRTSFAYVRPLREIIERTVSAEALRRSGVEFRCIAVDLHDGQTHTFTQKDDPTMALLASSAFPGVMPMVEVGGHAYTDGGVRDVSPLGVAIREGATKVLAIHMGQPSLGKARIKDAFARVGLELEIIMHEVLTADLAQAEHINMLARMARDLPTSHRDGDDVRFRGWQEVDVLVLGPDEKLGSGLDFSAESFARYEVVARRVARAEQERVQTWASR